MQKTRECKNCEFLDRKRNICIDNKKVFFNKKTGLPCCRFDNDAISYNEYIGENNEIR